MGLYRIYHDGWTAKSAYKEMLDIGFHTYLVFLDHYFREKSGLDRTFLVQQH